jgi:hypothetical protein
MVPFMVTTPFTGFIAAALGGVDYSLFIGLPVSAVLYLFFCRSLDLTTEFRMSDAEGKMPVAHAMSQSEISTDD